MTMTGEVQLPATRQAVWDKLNDPEVLKACIPGCEELEKTDDNGFRATAKMKVTIVVDNTMRREPIIWSMCSTISVDMN